MKYFSFFILFLALTSCNNFHSSVRLDSKQAALSENDQMYVFFEKYDELFEDAILVGTLSVNVLQGSLGNPTWEN